MSEMYTFEYHKKGCDKPSIGACFCIGPQNGEPLCPCRMKGVKEIDGKLYEVRGLQIVDATELKE